MSSDYAAFFAEAAAQIKREVPGMELGGPVLCWPPAESWGWIPDLLSFADFRKLLSFADFHSCEASRGPWASS